MRSVGLIPMGLAVKNKRLLFDLGRRRAQWRGQRRFSLAVSCSLSLFSLSLSLSPLYLFSCFIFLSILDGQSFSDFSNQFSCESSFFSSSLPTQPQISLLFPFSIHIKS